MIELKILYGSLETDMNKGLAQTAGYADSVSATESHLVIFNRNDKVSWEDKIWQRQGNYQSRKIDVWGC